MSDIVRAKQALLSGEYTCVLCKDGDTVTLTERGVKPLVRLLQSGRSYVGYSAADKVVGRATAFLYVLLGAREVYAKVMSKEALSVLRSAGIRTEIGTLCDNIINRRGDGICPFEAAVLDIGDAREAYDAVLEKMKEMGIE